MILKKFAPPIVATFILVLFFEISARTGLINSALIPAPSQCLATFLELFNEFMARTLETASAAIVGFLLSSFFGFILALWLFTIPVLKRATLPFAIFFQTVPIIAIAPLLVIYFGFGWGTVLTSSIIVSIFPVLANTLVGLESTSPEDLELFRLYRATKAQTLWKLRLPSAYLQIYSGLRIAAGLSVIGVVAGEFVAGGGLGALIDSARTQQRIDIVFCCLILLSLLGLAILASLGLTHSQILRHRPYLRSEKE